ncbi:MAG: hypothetical protein GWM90_10050 [Gemmatimonadetes bacterium]|nr:hypothetical protein [Gemmatimonadota bacterium]NIQ54271.1 hypothetical protein [Gemmatimonadota bacterium]NIU74482.1 hypothetical protein [Gammaproteobacteria bacterium]NIX44445.1 hypothetical protein [Gemmatimonadota bacterium]NIY08670.1 hypothetical protein [Gemmatimonadota bacterium]
MSTPLEVGAVPPPGAPAAGALELNRSLVERLDEAGVDYCHWKSNEHLDAAMMGLTDLDLLVDPASASAFGRVLAELGFKRFDSGSGQAYPAVEDHLGMDADTGTLVHLHVHYRLVLGEEGLKGYQLPWERRILAGRRKDPVWGAYTADPHDELVLLLVRSALKVRTRDRLPPRSGRPFVRGGALRELRWLAQRVDPDRLERTAAALVGAEAASTLPRLLESAPPPLLWRFRRAIRPSPELYRTHRPVAGRLLRWGREARALARLIARRLGFRTSRSGRRDPRGGVIIAVVGADGAGKSRLLGALSPWLARKLDVVSIYFGSGDGPVSLARRPFSLARWVAPGRRRERAQASTGSDRPTGGEPKSASRPWPWLRSAYHGSLALVLAEEKKGRLARARRSANAGRVVLCDRYPQTQFPGISDGPRLGAWLGHPRRLLRRLAAREQAIYRRAELSPPTLVLKLNVSPSVARARKPETRHQELERRIQVARDLRFPSATRVAVIDADAPFEQVLLRAQHAIWEAL